MKYKRLLSLTMALAMLFGSAAALPEGAFDEFASVSASAEVEGDYEYRMLDDGTVEITKYNGVGGEVTIPSTLGGKKVTSIGDNAFDLCSSLTGVTIPNSVTRIGSWAFDGCNSLTSVVIPNSVTSIGDRAFLWCDKLSSISIPESVTSIGGGAFSCTEWIEIQRNENPLVIVNGILIDGRICSGDVNIPNGVTSIGGEAFSDCRNITSIIIPNSVTSIGDYAFSMCPKLESVTLSDNITSIGFGVFTGCYSLKSITIPYGVTNIGSQAFSGCSSLESVTIPNSVTSIGESAFAWCKSLTSVTIPNSVTSIGIGAFCYCSNLVSITISNSVTSIGDYAFSQCSNLETITLGSGKTVFGENPFNECSKLAELIIQNDLQAFIDRDDSSSNFGELFSVLGIGKNISSIDVEKTSDFFKHLQSFNVDSENPNYSSVDGVLYNKDKTVLIRCPKAIPSVEIKIPKTVTAIADRAFFDCSNLEKITIPSSVTSIGEDAFVGTKWFDEQRGSDKNFVIVNGILVAVKTDSSIVTIPSGVRIISTGAFSGCSTVKAVTIPKGVVGISDHAFSGCENLASITIPNGVTTIGDYAFSNCKSLSSATIPSSVTRIGDEAFADCPLQPVDISANLTSLGKNAFTSDVNINSNNKVYCSIDGIVYDKAKTKMICCSTKKTSITIPDTIKSLDMELINKCKELSKLVLGKGITSIADEQFKDFSKLTSITLTDSVTSIGTSAFEDCKSLTSINIPESVTSIGDGAFMNCSSLSSVTVPNAVESIGPYTFYFCSGLEKLSIGSGVKSIGDGAFSHCSKLTSIIIGNSVETIGQYAFDGCSSLESLTIPDSVKSIDYGAFISCGKLTEVNIPQSVNVVGGYAFGYLDKSGGSVNGEINSAADSFTNEIQSEKYTKVKGFTILCSKGTAALKYAKENGFNYSVIIPSSRLAGTNRFSTAAAISKASYPNGAETVILAFGLNYADALAGVPLAEKLNAPILLTHTKTLPDETLAEIKRLGAKNVIILGGVGAINENVEKTLISNGLTTKRIAGQSRFGTATAIANELNKAPEELFFVYGLNSADALSVGGVAAAKGAPIIYLTTDGKLNADTEAYLKSVKGKVKNAYVIGGDGVISNAMMKNVATALGLKVGSTVQRVAGKNRYETCVAVNNKFKSVVSSDGICVAKGLDFPDALAGGVYAAKTKQALFLADGKKLQDIQINYLKSKNAGKLTVFGGTGAVSDELVKLIAQASV